MIAITRAVSEAVGRCELTHLRREVIDVGKAREQHEAYEGALRGLGVEVIRAKEEPDMPDAVFVEDTAVVIDEGAIMTCPGAESRRREVTSVASVLIRLGWLQWIDTPATLDGGDVLRVGKTLYVGQTRRTNAAGLEQLAAIVGVWGYKVVGVTVQGCLHLKSAVTLVGDGLFLINPAWVDKAVFVGGDFVEVAAGEEYGANGLLVAGHVLYATQFPRTRERLEARGVRVVGVDNSELAKAEGAMTCCCLLVSG
jgi:dimethylargininase